MQLLVGALIVGAILMASSMTNVEGWTTGAEYCQKLDDVMRQSTENFNNSNATYELAHSIIDPQSISSTSYGVLLDDAWQAVTYNRTCTPKSIEIVAAIYDCKPDRFESMRNTLGKNVREYTKKCFPSVATLVDMLRTRAYRYSSGERFMIDIDFISTYYRFSYGPQPLLPIQNFDCCHPESSGEALAESIIRLQNIRHEDAVAYFKRNPTMLVQFLELDLFGPCRYHVSLVDSIMKTAMMLEDINQHEKGTKILTGIPDDFKVSVFRYKFCKQLEEGRYTKMNVGYAVRKKFT